MTTLSDTLGSVKCADGGFGRNSQNVGAVHDDRLKLFIFAHQVQDTEDAQVAIPASTVANGHEVQQAAPIVQQAVPDLQQAVPYGQISNVNELHNSQVGGAGDSQTQVLSRSMVLPVAVTADTRREVAHLLRLSGIQIRDTDLNALEMQAVREATVDAGQVQRFFGSIRALTERREVTRLNERTLFEFSVPGIFRASFNFSVTPIVEVGGFLLFCEGSILYFLAYAPAAVATLLGGLNVLFVCFALLLLRFGRSVGLIRR